MRKRPINTLETNSIGSMRTATDQGANSAIQKSLTKRIWEPVEVILATKKALALLDTRNPMPAD